MLGYYFQLAFRNLRRNPGLTALMDAARLSGPPEPWHLGFLLGPEKEGTLAIPRRWWFAAGVGIVGGMPLPYSRRYEGLATALHEAFRQAALGCGADGFVNRVKQQSRYAPEQHHARRELVPPHGSVLEGLPVAHRNGRRNACSHARINLEKLPSKASLTAP